jgi:hypothetical protein
MRFYYIEVNINDLKDLLCYDPCEGVLYFPRGALRLKECNA